MVAAAAEAAEAMGIVVPDVTIASNAAMAVNSTTSTAPKPAKSPFLALSRARRLQSERVRDAMPASRIG